MDQLPLFVLAPEVLSLTAAWEPGIGWRLCARMRRQGQHWDDAYEAVYAGLSTPELFDVIAGEASARLGLV